MQNSWALESVTEAVVFLYSLVGLIHCTGPQRAVLHCFSKGIAVGKNSMEQQCCCTLNRDIKCTLKHRVDLGFSSVSLLAKHSALNILGASPLKDYSELGPKGAASG